MKLEAICKIVEEVQRMPPGSPYITIALHPNGIIVTARRHYGFLSVDCSQILPYAEVDALSDEAGDGVIRETLSRVMNAIMSDQRMGS